MIKCLCLGALSFPTPFLMYFYIFEISPSPNDHLARGMVVLFLILSGGMFGTLFYYKDSAIEGLKDWFPSKRRG